MLALKLSFDIYLVKVFSCVMISGKNNNPCLIIQNTITVNLKQYGHLIFICVFDDLVDECLQNIDFGSPLFI